MYSHQDTQTLRALEGPSPARGQRKNTLRTAAFALARHQATNDEIVTAVERAALRWEALRGGQWHRYRLLTKLVEEVRRAKITQRQRWCVLDLDERLLLRHEASAEAAVRWTQGPEAARPVAAIHQDDTAFPYSLARVKTQVQEGGTLASAVVHESELHAPEIAWTRGQLPVFALSERPWSVSL